MLKAMTLCLLSAGLVLAADPSGKWEATTQTQRGEMTMTFNLKADGEKLTGTVGNEMMGESEIQDGKVSGDEISFKQMMERGERKMTIEWKGKMKGDDELELTRSFAGRPGGGGGPGARGQRPEGQGGQGGGMRAPLIAKRVN
jgi:hypothetical protein